MIRWCAAPRRGLLIPCHLGPATTQISHKDFQIGPAKVVFSGFDGYRAGRQASWRALENPYAKRATVESSNSCFYEGHDPTRWSRRGLGRPSKPADSACPCRISDPTLMVEWTSTCGRPAPSSSPWRAPVGPYARRHLSRTAGRPPRGASHYARGGAQEAFHVRATPRGPRIGWNPRPSIVVESLSARQFADPGHQRWGSTPPRRRLRSRTLRPQERRLTRCAVPGIGLHKLRAGIPPEHGMLLERWRIFPNNEPLVRACHIRTRLVGRRSGPRRACNGVDKLFGRIRFPGHEWTNYWRKVEEMG